MTVPASLSKWAHPPRSNLPRSSSSGPPGPCITPSTETCVVVVSFMVAVPFSPGLSAFDSGGSARDRSRADKHRDVDPEIHTGCSAGDDDAEAKERAGDHDRVGEARRADDPEQPSGQDE